MAEIKSINGLAAANIKSVNWLAAANVKSWNWLTFPSAVSNWLLTGLVTYYKFDANSWTQVDSHWSNDATVQWATFDATWKINWDYSYATNDYMTMDWVVTSLASDTSWTFAAWVLLDDSTPSSSWAILAFWDTNANERVYLDVTWINGYLRCIVTDAWTTQWNLTSDSSPFSNWVYAHIALVQNATEAVFYINWAVLPSTFATSTDKTKWFSALTWLDNWRIWCINFNSGWNSAFHNWDIDELWFWSRALTLTDIQALYNWWDWLPYWDFTWPNTLLTGLVSYYDYDSNWSFPDSHWSNTWSINWATFSSWWWIISNCYDFDWTNDYIDVADNATLDFWTSDFTTNFWMYSDIATASNWYPLTKKDNASTNLAWWLIDADWWIRVADWSWNDSWWTASVTTAGEWVMVTHVFDRSWSCTIYENNILVWTVTISGSQNSVDNAIAMRIWWRIQSGSLTSPFDWKLDETWLWDRKLTVRERTDLYNGWAALAYSSFT